MLQRPSVDPLGAPNPEGGPLPSTSPTRPPPPRRQISMPTPPPRHSKSSPGLVNTAVNLAAEYIVHKSVSYQSSQPVCHHAPPPSHSPHCCVGSAPVCHSNSAPSCCSTAPAPSPLLSLLNELTTTGSRTTEGQPPPDGERRVAGVRVSTIRDTAICAVCCVACYRMFVCCCLPVHKCVCILSTFDTVIVATFTYTVFKHLISGEHDWLTILAFLFCAGFLTCQMIGTVFVFLAPRKKIAHYCWPRMVLIAGLLICSLIAMAVMIVYFSGQSTGMNNAVLAVYQYFFEDDLTPSEKNELVKELKWYAAAFMALIVVFALYTFFEGLLLRKLYREIQKAEFQPVSTNEPSAPPFNPDYPQKV